MTRKKRVNFIAILVLVFAFILTSFILAFDNLNTSNAISASPLIGSLTLGDYATRGDGYIFNGDILEKFYNAVLGPSGTGTYTNMYNKVKGSTASVTGTTDSGNKTISHIGSMNYADIKTATGSGIKVQLGGYTWDVVYLTTRTTGHETRADGDLIATLWMSDNLKNSSGNVVTTQWHNSSSPANPSASVDSTNMYSTSYIRNTTLKGSAFTQFNTGVLSSYIVSPNQVTYQRDENWAWSYTYSNMFAANIMPNEAWGRAVAGGGTGPDTTISKNGGSGWDVSMSQIESNSKYFNWANDKIWLPSLTETGYTNPDKSMPSDHVTYTDGSYGISLWGIPNGSSDNINTRSTLMWLRSGMFSDASQVYYLTLGGGAMFDSPTAQLAIRPALHLNLTKAESASLKSLPTPSDFSAEYTGSPIGVEKANWYTSTLASAIDVKYYNSSGSTELSAKPTDAGDYQVELTPKSGNAWSDGTTTKKIVIMEITPKQLTFPTISVDKKPYNGGDPVNFTITNPDAQYINIGVPTEYGGVELNTGQTTVRATNAGKYTLNVSLKNGLIQSNYEWKSGSPTSLQFEVERAPITLSVKGPNGESALSCSVSDTAFKVMIDISTFPFSDTGDKNVTAKILAKLKGSSGEQYEEVSQTPIKLSTTDLQPETTIDLSWLSSGDDYDIYLVIDDSAKGDDSKNYVIENQSMLALNVQGAAYRSKLTWTLTIDGKPTTRRVDVDPSTKSVTFDFGTDPLIYDGRLYGFVATDPSDYERISNENVSPSLTLLPENVGRYADSYTTSIQLRHNGTTETYSVLWIIHKAVFDLSDITWKYDGELPFSTAGTTTELENLPVGLKPVYGGNRTGNAVGQTGTATVTFSLDDAYKINYEVPTEANPNSYKFTPSTGHSSFEWSKPWTVVPAKIPVNWKEGVFQDKNGVDFNAYKLDSDLYAEIVEYLFYETDENGNILPTATPITADKLEVLNTAIKYYKIKPSIKSNFVGKYVLESEDMSTYFPVGNYSEPVEVDLANATLIYNGKAQNVTVTVVSGAIGANSFDIVYFDRGGTSPLSGAPINVGLYEAHITLKQGVNAHLVGDNVEGDTATIFFEITKRIINNSTWITSHNPPSLQVDFYDIKGMFYEYQDMDGNPLTFEQLKGGNSYKVRACISDKNNYEFANAFEDDVFNTDWQVFEVGENELLYDPVSPDNPFYPEDPDNPGNPDDPKDPGEGGGNVLDKIKEFFEQLIEKGFPLWQVATMAVAGLLTLIFLIKTIQYGNRKKKAKGEAKKLNAKTFAAIAPIFATDVAYAGLTNKIWSIIAFSVVALALVMFVVALIARKQWKKAELAKETAADDLEQRRIDAERSERREFQERITQVGQLSGDTNIEEILRQRDEEHRQEMEAMKLMLANLMGRNQADTEPIYGSIDDTDLLVQKVIAGLLPAVQQMMPEATAYLAAPSEENEELKALVEEQKALVEEQKAIVEEQSDQIRSMAEQMAYMQEQLTAMNEDRVEGVLLPDQSEEMKEISDQIAGLQEQLIAMTEDRVEGVLLPDESEEMKALTDKIAELQEQLITMSQQRVVVPNNQSDDIKALTDKIEELQDQLANSKSDTPDNSEEIKALTAQIAELQNRLENPAETIVTADNSEEIKALTAEMQKQFAKIDDLQNQLANMSQGGTTTVYVEKESEDDDVDDEEEWDSILDEDDDDFVEAVVIEEDGTVKKTSPNFRMRLKQSSDKNREWYTVIKNMFCSQKGVTYRVYKRVEKIRYQGQVVAVIGIAKRSIKLWLALKPYEYDARRYHHKDVSDKPRFVDVPMYVRVGSDRALTRAQELILALFQELNMEARKRYNDRSIQELIFTLKHNRLLTNKQNKQLLCEVMHVHDCDVLDDETAEKCIEAKNVDFIDDSIIETVKLDDIDANFQDGNRVTLEKLKKVGLVSENCTGYNVVADKRLTKPLIIVANDFTLTAVKLITLTGGRAIKLQQV